MIDETDNRAQIRQVRLPVARQTLFHVVWFGGAFCAAVLQPSGMVFMHPDETQKKLLLQFWAKFGGRSNNGFGFSTADKIQALKEMANVVIKYRHQRALGIRREDFNNNKVTLHKMNIRRNQTCFACGGNNSARHHIIQLQNGGLNSRKNLISICDQCHSEIHPWLAHQ